jgi:hypothetical protein
MGVLENRVLLAAARSSTAHQDQLARVSELLEEALCADSHRHRTGQERGT